MFEHWKDHFHPHEGNDHQPHAYRAAGAIALGLVAISIVAVTTIQLNFITHSEHFLSAVLPSVLVDLTNEDRQEEGLHALKRNETLDRAAQMKADHMAELGYFAHDGPNGTTPWEWFAEAGYQYETAGENLAINFSDSVDVEQAWMDSQLHRENILEEDFTEIGIATAKGKYEGEETVFVVQLFGTPSATELAERSDDIDMNTEVDQADEPEPEETTTVAVETDMDDSTTQEPAEDTATDTESDDSFSEDNQFAQADPEVDSDDGADTTNESATEQAGVDADTTATTEGEATTTQPTTPSISSSTDFSTTSDLADTFATPTPIAQVQGEAGIALQTSQSRIGQQASQLAHFLSRPESLFKTLMFTLFALVALSLLISVGVEAKRHHVDQASKALGALVLLIAVFYFGLMYLFPDTTVVSQSDSRLSATNVSLIASTPSS